MRSRRQRGWLLACLAVLLVTAGMVFAPAPTLAQARAKRLVLKDGSFQPVTKWEKKGDRVRYMSADRFVWEEIPDNLIDWPATTKYNSELAATSEEVKSIDEEERRERAKAEAESPEVAPGIKLPSQGGVFLLDQYHGQPQLVEIVQNGGTVNAQTGKNMLRAAIIPIPISRETIELTSPHAGVQAHLENPVLFANVDVVTTDTATSNAPVTKRSTRDLDTAIPDRYKLVRAKTKGEKRQLASVSVGFGQTAEHEEFVKADASAFSGGWVKITPEEPLTPGEYALVEMLGEDQMNLFVWDFGVNPQAPQNPTAWKPAEVKPNPTATTDSPILKSHPPK